MDWTGLGYKWVVDFCTQSNYVLDSVNTTNSLRRWVINTSTWRMTLWWCFVGWSLIACNEYKDFLVLVGRQKFPRNMWLHLLCYLDHKGVINQMRQVTLSLECTYLLNLSDFNITVSGSLTKCMWNLLKMLTTNFIS